MTVHLNRAAAVHARMLIEAGTVDRDAAWSFEAADSDALLGPDGNDWVEYARWFLGEDTAATPKTKDRYKYPVGKGGKVYRAALIAIRQRAGQQNAQAVFDEAGQLVALIDGDKSARGTLPSGASVRPRGPFEIRAAASGEPTEIFIYGDIGDSWDENAVTAAQFVRDLQNVNAAAINVRINSYGGAVSDGLAIYNALTRHPATVDTYVDGVAVSCASLIAMAGRNVTMAENALMMVHGPMAMAGGNAQDLRAAADVLDRYAQAMAPCYAAKTGQSVADALAVLTDGEDHWFTASDALAARLVDAVSPAAAVEARFDLGRFRSLPAALAAFTTTKGRTPMPVTQPAGTQAQPAAHQPDPVAAAATAVQAASAAAAAANAGAASLALVPAAGRSYEQNAEIRAFFAPFMAQEGVRALYDDVMVDTRISVEQVRARLMAKLGENQTPANPAGVHAEAADPSAWPNAGRVAMGASERDKFVEAASIAIRARAGAHMVTAQERTDLRANPLRGLKLLDIARASLERARIDVRGLSQLEVVAQAFTQGTSDFPVLLENVMHKSLQMAYGTTPDTWSRFCSVGSVSDFRAANRYRLGTFGNLDSLNELGEFHNKSVPDGEKATITASTKGNIINLSRQTIINDDLNAFVGLAAGLGRAARRTIEVDVYALLAQNAGAGPLMADGNNLFSAAHGNLAASGAVPGVATIAAGRTAIASQKDVSGNDFLDLQPMIFLGNIGNGDTARVTNDALYDTDVTSKFQVPNKVKGMFREVVGSPRIATTNWYMFCDPTVAPVTEVAFLDGNQEPYIELQQGFEVDGARYKVRLDYGTAVIDYRGAYCNPGA